MSADEIKALLQLQPHPKEGGWYRRTYTSDVSVALLRGVRPYGTAIYYLLEEGTFDEMHMIASDEVFHFYLGDPVEMLLLYPSGQSVLLTLGQDLAAGQRPQIHVPAGVWQGERMVEGGKLALFGCTVTPGFDFADYRSGNYAELAAGWPQEAARIRKLTKA
ncbi:conserved hypothetical protein [Candidatus Sulfotelmatomonas gaucii]|uniref:DUF985 domain-containing protein n=1 Tax=Candidatus Sulfuritelmatomonas gaucii TaxID=2043161 RepID=A0A2N9L9Z7_9BACT|nr:conserved hypothetical protein [Candidatus Sulfotelmatomonas gaucii]